MESIEYKIIPLDKIHPGKFQLREDVELSEIRLRRKKVFNGDDVVCFNVFLPISR